MFSWFEAVMQSQEKVGGSYANPREGREFA